MPFIGSGLRYNVNLAATVISIFRVEVVRLDAEFSNGVEVRNRAGAGKTRFLHTYSVKDESVGRFPLAIDGNRSGVQPTGNLRQGKTGGSERTRISPAYLRCLRHNTWL